MTIYILNLKKERPRYPFDFKVDRTTPLGNPFFMKSEKERDLVCDEYEKYFSAFIQKQEVKEYFDEIVKSYKQNGRVRLFCWCVPKRCHAFTIKQEIIKEINR
jgi:hypothetical protein